MPHRYYWQKLKQVLVYRVLHADDTPHRIALGVAVGVAVAWTPTVGVQMIVAVAIATLLRANKIASVPFVWISNPLTLWPIFYPNYLLGRWILGSQGRAPDFRTVFSHGDTLVERLGNFWVETWHVFGPLWLGSSIVAITVGAGAYFIALRVIIVYRARRERRSRSAERSKARLPDGPPGRVDTSTPVQE